MTAATSPLRRTVPAPPVRIVHLGLGAFSRSHTAWYTGAAADAPEWGISAYTGRSRALADALTAQDGVFTLVERDADGDRAGVVESIVSARSGEEGAAVVAEIAAPSTAIVTLTITEVAYLLDEHDRPDTADPVVVADDALLRAAIGGEADAAIAPASALGRLLWALELRRRAGAGGLAVVPCDNIPDNGGRLRRGIRACAGELSPALASWIDDHVSFVSTSIDRITPRVDPEEARALSAEYGDLAPVVAEPFRDWVLSGDFPAGRPAWESAGARFVDDIEPWEARKLWLLNGAHTLLSALGRLRGHRTVAEAIADADCRAAVAAFWDEAQRHLPAELAVDDYRAALLRRFENPRIAHELAQIATDIATKVRLRIVPVAERELSAGRTAAGCAAAIGAWLAAADDGLVAGPVSDAPTASAVASVSTRLGEDERFVALVDARRRS